MSEHTSPKRERGSDLQGLSSPLPPGQQWAAVGKWPLVGERQPARIVAPWRVTVTGEVAQPLNLSLDELRGLGTLERIVDIHCVTRWSMPRAPFGGVPLATVLALTGPLPSARFASFMAHSDRGHSTSLSLDDALRLEALIVLDYDGRPLAQEHGGPVRMVVPGRYFYKSLKWLKRIELLNVDRLGYWEAEAGYHNGADPWRSERYIAPSLTKQEALAVLASRDIAGRDLRGLAAAGRDLSGLSAAGAILRDADFQRCILTKADFGRANLSNAHFVQADLREASFREADLEGADFTGADLRGADLCGALLTAATLCPDPPNADIRPAILDRSTKLFVEATADLTPIQQQFVLHCLAG